MHKGIYYSTIEDERVLTGEEMDSERNKNRVYEYLCHLQEAKEWLEKEIGETVAGDAESFEEALRDGVYLAKLVRVFAPELCRHIFTDAVLQYRHTDNINAFFEFTRKVELPYVFLFEVVDLYEKKNPPKVVYCIHALAHFLAQKNITSQLGNLVGHAVFTDDVISKKAKEIGMSGVSLPSFGNITTQMERSMCASVPSVPAKKERDGEESEEESVEGIKGREGREGRTLGAERTLKEEEGSYVSCREEDLPSLEDPSVYHAVSVVQTYLRTLLRKKGLREIKGSAPVTIFTLKMFLPLLSGKEEKDEAEIDELNKILTVLFAENASKEKKLNDLENRISLLIRNKMGRKTKESKEAKEAKEVREENTYTQYKSLQKLFALLHDTPSVLVKMVLSMRQREAESFVSSKLLSLFGQVKTPKEEYNYLRVVEELLKEEGRDGKDSSQLRYLAGYALRALLNAHGLTRVQRKIRERILERKERKEGQGQGQGQGQGHGQGVSSEGAVFQALAEEMHDLPYGFRFYARTLLETLNKKSASMQSSTGKDAGKRAEKERDAAESMERARDANLETLFLTLWDIFFTPMIVAPEMFHAKKQGTGEGADKGTDKGTGVSESAENRALLNTVCSRVAKCVREGGSEWKEFARHFRSIGSVVPISEYYTQQYIENRQMSHLLCLMGEEINYLLGALKDAPNTSAEVRELVSKCFPFPFKLVFVVPGGFSMHAQESTGTVEKKLAKWALVKLLLCSTGKNVTDLLQRRSSVEEAETFNEIWSVDIEKYKDDTKILLARLFDLGLIKNIHNCEEILSMISADILYRVRNRDSRRREIEATEKAISSLEEARQDIETRQKLYAKYLVSLSTKIVESTKEHIHPAKSLLISGVFTKMYNWVPSQLDSIDVLFRREVNGTICITVLVLRMPSASEIITLDELLLKDSRSEAELQMEGIGCTVSVPKMIAFINKRFLL
ncbi:hypothetical protein NECID01_0470 [Nematocida sp. AWRm77]|nr:hypothetical protein NECID01_0470 [Nematocida sp. AWRm77]